MVNAIWLEKTRINQILNGKTQLVTDISNGNIKLIFLELGEWNPNHTIDYDYNDAQIATIISMFKSINRTFKLFPWMPSGRWHNHPDIDFSTSAYRQQLVNAAVACVNKGFDGFEDDTEGHIGTEQNYWDYLDLLTNAMHSIGKLSACALMALEAQNYAGTYGNARVDYIKAMLYGGYAWDEPKYKTAMRRVLAASISPVLISMPIQDSNYKTPMISYMNWIDSVLTEGIDASKLAGFAIYDGWNEGMSYGNNWASWNNWSTKGLVTPPVVPPVEPPIEPPVIVPATRTLVAQALPYPLLLAKLWRLRTRFIREDIHRKVHPLI